MSPHNRNTSSAPIKYYSAYRGPVFGPKGDFSHFARHCDPPHIQNGYWRFSTAADERRAYELGMTDPEAILMAQDACDGDYSDIMLHWMPGELDKNNKPSIGSAAAHLETIYNERKLLNKTLSFQGQVPLYPISTDDKLLQYRVIRYAIQKGALPPTTLLSSSRQLPLPEPVAPSSVPEEMNKISSARTSRPSSIRVRDDRSPEAESRSISIPQGLPESELPPHATSPYQPSVSRATRNSLQLNRNKTSTEYPQSSSVCHDQFSIPSPASSESMSWGSPDSSKRSRDRSRMRQHNYDRRRESIRADKEDGAAIMNRGDSLANALIDSHSAPASTAGGQFHAFEAQIAVIPCMDCGFVGFHTPGCWIDKAAMSLKPINELGLDKIRDLTESVSKFDAEPHKTHEEPQLDEIRDLAKLVTRFDPELCRTQEEPQSEDEGQEDPETQIRSMAEVIRNLDGSAEDPDLQMLDDRATVLLWAFKACSDVEIVRE